MIGQVEGGELDEHGVLLDFLDQRDLTR